MTVRTSPPLSTVPERPAQPGRASPPGRPGCWPVGRWRLAVFDMVLGSAGSCRQVVAGRRARWCPGEPAMTLTGPTAGILTAERTALNLLTHLSGIATLTRAWVDAVAGTGARIRDTRKTLPGLRALEKYAVRCGGGVNHRMSLGDAALIKDNHVAAAGSVRAAIAAVRARRCDDPAGGRGRHPRSVRRGRAGRRRTRSAGQLLDRGHGRRRCAGPGPAAAPCCWRPPAG